MNYDRPYHGRGGYRRRYHREDYDSREVLETPEQKLRSAIIKLGEVDPVQEIPRVVTQICEQNPISVPAIAEGFRIGVTEQPYKIPYYAALLRLLYYHTEEGPGMEGSSLGKQILEDFWKGFQAFLDQLAWREMRLCIHFFAHLTVAEVVAAETLSSLLQSFTAVLDEFGVSHGRAKRAALCAAEGLMIGGRILKATFPVRVSEIITAIQGYNESTSNAKWLVLPTSVSSPEGATAPAVANELLDMVLASLKTLDLSGFEDVASTFPQPYSEFANIDPVVTPPFPLPSVLVPPEIIEMDTLSADAGEDTQVKKEEWPEYYLCFFDNDITPEASSPSGYAVRSALLDIVDIFELNRKECARLLLEYPKWAIPGTFKPKPGAPMDPNPLPGKDWQLESTIIELVLGSFLVLPEPTHKSVYYMSLITELCKLSPSTIGPAVGKCIRKLYNNLAEGLDVDISRRFAEWFSVHMSNFGFQWVWKEWATDLNLAGQHPKRAFIRRALEFEIRLSYHERILKALPEAMQVSEAKLILQEPPGPHFEYDDPDHPQHDAAQTVLNLFRGRNKADDVISHLDNLKNSLEASEESINVDAVLRSIAVQSLLHIGSRSFSHLLNAIERYLPLLRNLAGGGVGSSNDAKSDILDAVASFWKRNPHMVGIVFDKLMQYQIVDPNDVIGWTFVKGTSVRGQGQQYLGAFEWDLLKGALDKANGRVMVARKKVITLRKEDDDTRARAKARENTSMEVDTEAKPDEPEVENPALTLALKAFRTLTREQKAALSTTLEGFVSCLVPVPSDSTSTHPARRAINEQAWQDRSNWETDVWSAWETWGWYRHFCRSFAPYLRNYSVTLSTVSFAEIEGSTDPAAILMKKIWNVAIGQE